MVKSRRVKTLLCLLNVVLPLPIKRLVMNRLLGWDISPTAIVGFSFVNVGRLVMEQSARIGHLNAIQNLDRLEFGACAKMGNLNWVNGVRSTGSRLYPNQVQRRSRLRLGEHASITGRHLIDCADAVTIGAFTTIAGARSQIVTHGIDVETNRQDTAPIEIGKYCYVGTASVILKGAKLPDFSILGACSLLSKRYEDSFHVYGGVPARPIKAIDRESLFFKREVGVVD